MIVKDETKDRFALPAEDYLHGIVGLVNELVRKCSQLVRTRVVWANTPPLQSRLAVNSVTLGNFEEPIKISLFVREIFAGFTVVGHPYRFMGFSAHATARQLNLKNDALRRRFDSLKYDIKKIEEGMSSVSLSVTRLADHSKYSVVYDVSLRKLASPRAPPLG